MLRRRCVSLLMVAGAWVAAAGVASAQMKVAVLNSQKALLDTVEIQKAQKELQSKYQPQQDRAAKLQDELQKLQSQLETMRGKLQPAAEQDMMTQGKRKQTELQRLTDDLQGEVDRDRQDILQAAANRMQEVVKKLAEAGNYDLVVDVSNAVFFKPALEITKDATAAYDKAYPPKAK